MSGDNSGQVSSDPDEGGYSPASGYYETLDGEVVALTVNQSENGYTGLYDTEGTFYAFDYKSGAVWSLDSGAIKPVCFECNLIGGAAAYKGASGVKRWSGFRGPERGRWKDQGQWQEGWHFHLGTGGGLQKHHLPQQSGNWWRNFKGLMKQK